MTRQTNIVALVAWMAGALVSFSATAVALRELKGSLALFDMLAARTAFGIAITLAIGFAQRRGDDFAPRRLVLHVQRNVVHFVGVLTWSLGVTLLPLATVFALEFTAPAWVTLLAAAFLGERLTKPRLVAVAFGVAGVLVILRPGREVFDPTSLIVLGAALAFAITTVCTKALTNTESTLAILFWMNAIQFPMNVVAGLLAPSAATAPFGTHQALALAALCLGGFSSHWCLTRAYRYGDAILVVPLDFLRIPLIALVGWWAYREALDPLVFAGAGLIVVGILGSLVGETRGARR